MPSRNLSSKLTSLVDEERISPFAARDRPFAPPPYPLLTGKRMVRAVVDLGNLLDVSSEERCQRPITSRADHFSALMESRHSVTTLSHYA